MWVLRFTILVAAVLATLMAITVKSIYGLFYLCGDFVMVMLFPQLACVIHMKKSNGYGSFCGWVVGLVLRLIGGEPMLQLPAAIHYPWYSEDYGQLFPFKTTSMVCSLVTIIIVSLITHALFTSGTLSPKYDIFRAFVETESDDVDLKEKPSERNGNSNPAYSEEM